MKSKYRRAWVKPVAEFVAVMLFGIVLASVGVAGTAYVLGSHAPWIAVMYAEFAAVFVALVAAPQHKRGIALYGLFCIAFGAAAAAFDIHYIQP